MTKLLFQDRNRHIVFLPCDLERFHLPSVLVRFLLKSLYAVSIDRQHQHLLPVCGLGSGGRRPVPYQEIQRKQNGDAQQEQFHHGIRFHKSCTPINNSTAPIGAD